MIDIMIMILVVLITYRLHLLFILFIFIVLVISISLYSPLPHDSYWDIDGVFTYSSIVSFIDIPISIISAVLQFKHLVIG